MRKCSCACSVLLSALLAAAAVQHKSPPPGPEVFSAVSIKVFAPPARSRPLVMDPAGLHVVGRTLHTLIEIAFVINDRQLLGGAPWTRTTKYSVDATTSKPATQDQELRMLANALVTRFGLKLSRRSRTMPVYALVVSATGLKVSPLSAGDWPNFRNLNPPPGECPYRAEATMARWAYFLNQDFSNFDKPVVDETGLKGQYNMPLCLPCDEVRLMGPGEPEIRAAMRQQFGLDLKPTTATFEFTTIVAAHPPLPN